MRSTLADYRILGPAPGLEGPPGRAWLATPPDRLDQSDPVVLVELDQVDDATWRVVSRRLVELAAVRSEHLPRLLDAGRTRDDRQHVAWACRDHGSTVPLTAPVPDRRAALRTLAGAARAAHDLHEAGWAHGDIRVSSILQDGGRSLLDLPLRTIAYVPPIVARVPAPAELDGTEADALWGYGPSRASDVYALGAAAHRLLTGKPIHPELTSDQPVTAVQRVLVERPRLDVGLTGPVGDLVRSCLDPDAGRRPASAAVLAERFDELAGDGA